MSTLTQFFPKSSESPVGEIRMVVGGLYNSQPVITAADGSVWLRENALYPISAYPEAAKRFYGAGGEYVFSGMFTSGGVTPATAAFGNDKAFLGGNWSQSARSSASGINAFEFFSFPGGYSGNIVSVSFGSGRFIVGGDSASGIVQTSTDLNTWSAAALFSQLYNIDAVAAGGGLFVAATTGQLSSGQNFARSTNGISWTTVTAGMYNGPRAMAYGQGKFVCVNQYGRVETSTDGLTWSGPRLLDNANGDRICYQFAYGNGVYVGVGDQNTGGNRGLIITSTDGEVWETRTKQTQVLQTVTYGNGTWVVGGLSGYVATSTDNGATWTSRTFGSTNPINSIIYTDQFIAAGPSGMIRTSTDGITWTSRNSNSGLAISNLAYSSVNNRIVYVGSGGNLGYSSDGITWTNNYNGNPYTGQDISEVAYGNGVFVATGTGSRVIKSTDGITWTKCMPITAVSDAAFLPQLAYNSTAGLFGVHYVDTLGGIHMYTSTNGDTWISRTDESGINFPSSGQGRLFGWSATNGKFIGITDWSFSGGIYQTTDGTVWNHLPYATNGTQYRTIAFGGGQWVVAGDYGNIYTSTDARSWVYRGTSLAENIQSQNIKSVAYNTNSGLWVYAGNRMLGCSTDAITWEPLAQNNGNLNAVGGFSEYNYVCAGGAKSFYAVGILTALNAAQSYFRGYSSDPTVAYSTSFDASQYFYVPAISSSTYTVGTTSTGTQVSGQFIATYNTEAVAYVKGK